MENIKSKDGMIEICMSDTKKAGRVIIKMSALKICEKDNFDDYNKNGLHWEEEYCNDNIESAIGMDYVVSFIDEESQIPSGHGDMTFDDDGNIVFENSVSVGHVEEVYIEDVEVDGVMQKLLVTKGYINVQRYNKFYDWLKTEVANGRVCGSIEINGKGDNSKIKYLNDKQYNDDGSLYFGRTPQIFDFSGLAILCKEIEEPADDLSIVIECNTNQNATDNSVSDKNEKGVSQMEHEKFEAQIAELNTKIETFTNSVTEKDAKIVELNEVIVSANKSQEELNSQVESMAKELEECKAELQAYKDKEAQAKEEEKKAEVNSYMTEEISKNGFTEVEINSFSALVEACDLDGIKKLESELCTAKFKAEINAKKEVEVNSKQTKDTEVCSMFTIKEPKKVVIGDEMPSFFK